MIGNGISHSRIVKNLAALEWAVLYHLIRNLRAR